MLLRTHLHIVIVSHYRDVLERLKLEFFFHCYTDPRTLHSFPTRRSSDPRGSAQHRRGHGPRLLEAARRVRAQRGARHPRERLEEHTSELQSRLHLVCRLQHEKKNQIGRQGRKAQKHIDCELARVVSTSLT